MKDIKVYKLDKNELIIFDPELNLDLKSNLKIEEKHEYYENKKIQATMCYHENFLHGPATFFSTVGNVLSITWFFMGKRNGRVYRYYNSSKLYSKEIYINDLLEGEQKYFFEDGTKKTVMNYKDGVLDGEVFLFFENSSIKRHLIFKNGEKLQDKIFDESGKVLDESKFAL